MVYSGTPIKNGWFRGTPTLGNLHIDDWHWFAYYTWWFFIAILVYQKVAIKKTVALRQGLTGKHHLRSLLDWFPVAELSEKKRNKGPEVNGFPEVLFLEDHSTDDWVITLVSPRCVGRKSINGWHTSHMQPMVLEYVSTFTPKIIQFCR